jgi:hypothetical protein
VTWWDAIVRGLERIRLTLERLLGGLAGEVILVLAFIGLVGLSILEPLFTLDLDNLIHGTNKPQTFEERITTLTNSLNDAARQVSEIEKEIAQRKQLADQL